MVEQQRALPANDSLDILPSGGKTADDAQIASSLNDFLQRYVPEANTAPRDILSGRYRIDVNNPLPEYDTRNARAYAASDAMDSGKSIYALVCKLGTYQRHSAIKMSTGIEHPNILALWASGVVLLSQPEEERFVLFYSRPRGKKLSDLMANLKGPIGDTFISKSVLAPLIAAVGKISELGFTHGAIRPDNIYFGDVPVLGDCLTESCGYSQPFYFETIDRMQTTPSAKGEGSISHDYYSLAILSIYMLYGEAHFSGYTIEGLTNRILREGAYAALLRNKEPPELFNDFLRGLLSGNVNERWDFRNLKQWIEGKRSNIMLPAAPIEALRSFEFAGMQIGTKRELAHQFHTHWQQTLDLMRTEHLILWVSMSLRNKDLAESLKKIKRVISETNIKNEIQISEQIMRMLLLFDPNGPIRINNLSFYLDGMDSLCVELSNSKSTNELKLLSKYIEHSMSTDWLDTQRSGPDYVMPESINAISLKLDRLRLFIRNVGYGFGLERMLYELNPEMPCLSPYFSNSFINTLPSLLKQLDKMAAKNFKEQYPIDYHIAAFIASKLGILHDVKLHELIPHPSLASDKGIVALRLISMAQSRCGDLSLPGLSEWLAYKVVPALEIIKSRTLRSRIKAMMVERAKTGYTQYMAELVIDSNYAVADVSGYGRATTVYNENIERIAYYKTDEVIARKSAQVGFGIAKFFAYIVFALVLYKTWVSK